MENSSEQIAKWGFGMAPISKVMLRRYNFAVSRFSHYLNTDNEQVSLEAISELKGMFNRSLKKDQWDWHSVYEKLNTPSIGEMLYFVQKLTLLRKLLKDDNISDANKLKQEFINSTIRNYLNTWSGQKAVSNKESGWLYILSRREEPDLLKIGMTTRSVTLRVKEINSATGLLYPFSARSVYKVKDPLLTEKQVHKILADYRVRSDREFFKVKFGFAVSQIEKLLKEQGCFLKEIGTIKFYHPKKGYGFIEREQKDDLFFHIDDFVNTESVVCEGSCVEFFIKNTSKGQTATSIILTPTRV